MVLDFTGVLDVFCQGVFRADTFRLTLIFDFAGVFRAGKRIKMGAGLSELAGQSRGIRIRNVPDCFEALLESLGKEENRLAMDKAQQRTIKFVRPTDECDICEGGGVDFGIDRFEPVRSAVRENALWSLVILSSHGAALAGKALEATLLVLRDVIHNDKNAICVGLAMDALNRIAHLHSQDAKEIPLIKNLQTELRKILKDDAIQSWETMVRGGLKPKVLSGLQSSES